MPGRSNRCPRIGDITRFGLQRVMSPIRHRCNISSGTSIPIYDNPVLPDTCGRYMWKPVCGQSGCCACTRCEHTCRNTGGQMYYDYLYQKTLEKAMVNYPGIKVLASVACPPSPLEARCPFPRTVETVPFFMSILRIRSLELSQTYRSPLESKVRCSG